MAGLVERLQAEPTLAIGVSVALVLVAAATFFLFGKKAKFLNGTRQQVVLVERHQLSHDTVRFRFLLPKSAPVFGLPCGKHVKIYAPTPKGVVPGQWNGREDSEQERTEIERKYTPTTSDDEVGYVDLVIKVYKGGVIDRFPDGGKMSQYMDTLKVGDKLDISGPWGHNEYKGHGQFLVSKKPRTCKKLGMMAGGTGITPMLQVMKAILRDPSDKTEMSLIYANQTEDDILVRPELEELQAKYPKRLKIWYTLDRPPKSWKYSTGFINENMIAEHL